MDQATVFTKTAKGITQVNQRSASLSKDLMKVLKLIDGKSNFGQIMEKADLDKGQLEKALNTLTRDGFARVFQVRKEEADPFADDDFDFTAPNKLPGSTQRVVAGAANDISELVREQQKADADRKAREQAHEMARLKAKTEAETRAKLEAEASARQQAELQAMEQARRAKEASERARAELEAKMREEEARKRALAEQQARLSAEQKAREEEEGRKLAELRAKAEREAKALAEARARAEAEAQAMARARAEAEAAARRQAAEASNAEQQLKARLKEEIEARIRREMEELLRNEIEEKARSEMQAQILAEARLAAKAELEERLREERQALASAELDARARAEREARARAEEEARKRAQAEARAAAESEARIKAEEEARRLKQQAEEIRAKSEAEARRIKQEAEREAQRLRDAEARARGEAEARAREQKQAEQQLDAERRAKVEIEARAMVEAEERERRERELSETLEAERRAKEAAEMRARIEARARETIAADTRVKVQAELEADMEKRAELEGKAQARAYMEAKAKAELDEEQRLREEQARKAREIAEVLRTKVESDEVAPESMPARKRRPRKPGRLVRPILVGAAAAIILGIGLLHVVPLRPYTAKVERAMSAWLNDDVSITAMTFRLVPSPHLRVEGLAVGKLLDARAATGRIYLDITSLFGERPNINTIELDNVAVGAEAVKRIPVWGQPGGKAQGGIDLVRLRGVTLDVKPVVPPFDATLAFSRQGAMQSVELRAPGWVVALKPAGEKVFDVSATVRNWTLPMGVPIPIGEAQLKGRLTATEVVIPEFEADAMEGKVNGTLRVSWAAAPRLESELSVARLDAKLLVGAFTRDISVTGRLDGNFSFATEGPTFEKLFAAPRAQGKFRLSEGSVSNVDLVAVMQSDAAGQRAGVTKFAELSGEVATADHRTSFRQVNLQGGVLRGNGGVEVGNSSNLAGRLALEIRSQVAQDRGAFSVSGTVARPIIKRGG